MFQENPSNLSPVISLVNDQPRTLSTDVASYFGKRHDNVMRQIRRIIADSPERFHALNFEEMYVDVQIGNGATRKEPAYSMTKDGFTLLAMGFTGPKALQFKISYIEAFTWMEKKLIKVSQTPFQLTGDNRPKEAKSTVADRKPLKDLINTWVNIAPLGPPQAWKQVKAAFGVTLAEELTVGQIAPACAWVQERIDSIQQTITAAVASQSTDAVLPRLKEPVIDHRQRTRAMFKGSLIVAGLNSTDKGINEFFTFYNDMLKKLKAQDCDKVAMDRLCALIDVFRPYVAAFSMLRLFVESLVEQALAAMDLMTAMQNQHA
ncbi:hypothetical protein C4J81_03465 [Deltaproteobacteria bacterium Smac51]|nr:hypothetical protein C4J81_03465 [Deltaproteobacteria bacterium Smac51]